ncbi:serine protease MucD - like protein [Thioalkalivibrio nitratireducens DSM 14787]|uniref:Probable periplasmic serine endoprotease DegP-like n=1 Tax=Thioalkalivibrio nitratireducens (strain DSM 14787 / UNIQEM 213 / ALEN2) TaxID=1255043 RepID=L0DU17_THIND|nr:DegQ family serine endoprotease [Thioalkalivibrio nitratireducens]AGA32513.1 serine protease MucD - like protein [Thioalkalivibrio nitratireducens DSM 14787]
MKIYRWFVLAVVLIAFSAPVAAGQLPDFVPLAEEYSPAVVNISSTRERASAEGGREMPELPEGMPFGDLLERFFGERGMPQPFERERASLGSGFIYTADGYILTNHHVVEGASEIVVRLSDRRVFTAELVGSDPQSDVAVLKIDADDLPTLKLGSSERLRVGEWVLAIGSPFGFDHSVTAGIVSAKGRSLPSDNYVPFIQTDVAINPGNSGGPLFNLDGEVVGINSQIYSRTGGFMGLSFAIPIEMAVEVAEQLRETGTVTRGWLGVLIQEVTRELADSFGMSRPTGALVAQVQPNSPAERAGFRTGDVILRFNGIDVPRSSALPPIVGRTPVDSEVEVDVRRGSEEIVIEVTIDALPEEVAAGRGMPPRATEPQTLLGMQIEPLGAEERSALGLGETGVRVRGVTGNPARAAGIAAGDVIAQFAGEAVSSPEDLEEKANAAEPGRSVAVLIHRDGNPVFIALRIPNP